MGEGRAQNEAFQRYPGGIKDIVIPAKAGIQVDLRSCFFWMPDQVRHDGEWIPDQVRHDGEWMPDQVRHDGNGCWIE
jgi:hypothetical protein